MTIQIEISQSGCIKDRWGIRIGDIEGSTELSNITEKELLREIKEQLKIEKKLKGEKK